MSILCSASVRVWLQVNINQNFLHVLIIHIFNALHFYPKKAYGHYFTSRSEKSSVSALFDLLWLNSAEMKAIQLQQSAALRDKYKTDGITFRLRFTSVPWEIRYLRSLQWPFWAVMKRGVAPSTICEWMSAPWPSSSSTTSWWLHWHATNNGVPPS